MLNEKAPERAGLFYFVRRFGFRPTTIPRSICNREGYQKPLPHIRVGDRRCPDQRLQAIFPCPSHSPTGGGFDRNIYPNRNFLFAIFGFPVRR